MSHAGRLWRLFSLAVTCLSAVSAALAQSPALSTVNDPVYRAGVGDALDFMAGIHYRRRIRRGRTGQERRAGIQRHLQRATCAECRRHARSHIRRRLSTGRRNREIRAMVRWDRVSANRGAGATTKLGSRMVWEK